ncbi:hypothetical protein MNBD_IGNAVI01-454 [hydrothermal vent metagenome]|uniref:Methyltransferase FkbM domain-containing protein n=1 Tax=hydrothermal vent metagenome TaxID=652676 RepID=A0A3B1C5N8_9ZZZZ
MLKNSVYYKNEDLHIAIPDNNSRNRLFPGRDSCEVLFRLLINYLYKNKLIDSNKNIIDLGAWIGDNSIPWAMKINGNVYAIDPSEENINYINELSKLNELNNVITIAKCISEKEEYVYSNDEFTKSEYIATAIFNHKKGKNKIKAVSLDKLYQLKTIENIGFIHLDVEGFEQKVLNGSTNLIDKYRPIIIWENHLNTDNYEQTIVFLKNKNYDSYLINEAFPHTREDCRNFLSIPVESEISERINTINDYFRNILTENKADKSKPLLIKISTNQLRVVFKRLVLWLRKIF